MRKKAPPQMDQLSLFAPVEPAQTAEAPEPSGSLTELPMDWGDLFDPTPDGPAPDGPDLQDPAAAIADGLVLSLTTLGRVDIPYIARSANADASTVIDTLRGSIYQNPETWDGDPLRGWETSSEYLSGNLSRKYKAAAAANDSGRFTENLQAIQAVLPPALDTKDIYITLGSPWVPPDIIDDFILFLFGSNYKSFYSYIYPPCVFQTLHDEITGTWEIPKKTRYGSRVKVTQTYGTQRMNALQILERTLNMRSLTVTDEVKDPADPSKTHRVLNREQTLAVQERQQKLIRAFQHWVWKDETRKARLEAIFEENYSCVRRRVFDGSFLTFPTLSPNVELYPYQKDAVARILFTPNTLLAHDVGSGKTYEMIAAGQELRRMGLSRKNLYVVPNNILGQWRDIFLLMYPDARLLVVGPKEFSVKRRQEVLAQMRDEDFDGILIAYSCFERIPLSKDCRLRELEAQREALSRTAAQPRKATKGIRAREKSLKKAIGDLVTAGDDGGICFDELGVTRLFIDEAHNFKNVPLETKITNVLGLSPGGSAKCRDMMDKVHLVQREGGGAVLATGTPITNSVTDAYVMQQYLQSGELALLELQSFDSWVGMFAEAATEFEIDVDTGTYRLATRFSRFHNLPELTALLSSIADFHQVDLTAGIPGHDGYRDVLVPKTPEFAAYLKDISARAEAVRAGLVARTEDNMLKITTDGRKAALDLRLVEPGSPFTFRSKAARCAENAAELYFKSTAEKGAQLIFCDTSTPKAGFNLYDELKTRLTELGVFEEDIAFVHDARNEKQRDALFAAVRDGRVRVLIGSTFKLGLGVNVQDRLVALHHLDVPWRPADMTQREGRILRRGNQNASVFLYRYITEGSFDAYSWQLLETKQRFIADLLSGSLTARSGSDIKDTVLSYAEVKALAVGNPLVKKRVEAANALSRFQMLQKQQIELRLRLERELAALPGNMRKQKERIERSREDRDAYRAWKSAREALEGHEKLDKDERRALREKLRAGLDAPASDGEVLLARYRGFDVLRPAYMNIRFPYVWLVRAGRYSVELGESGTGNALRVDHFLDGLEDYAARQEQALEDLRSRGVEIRGELARGEDYAGEIERYRKRVERLDKELGVDLS